MKGNNTFNFNTSTMVEIVQYYLDNVMLKEKNVKVTTVKLSTKSMSDTFEIKTEEIENPKISRRDELVGQGFAEPVGSAD